MKKRESVGKVLVHHECRRRFTEKRKAHVDLGTCSKRLRSSAGERDQFQWKLHCLFCAKEKNNKRKLSDTSEVETIPIINHILDQCNVRDDDWGNSVRDRVLPSIDIVADEGFYHRSCMAKFFKESLVCIHFLGRVLIVVLELSFFCMLQFMLPFIVYSLSLVSWFNIIKLQ